MAHPEGFEPSTARFEAEYSIQLSYGCNKSKDNYYLIFYTKKQMDHTKLRLLDDGSEVAHLHSKIKIQPYSNRKVLY